MKCVHRSSVDVLSSHMSTCTQAPSFHTGCSGKLKPGNILYKQAMWSPKFTWVQLPNLPCSRSQTQGEEFFHKELIKNLNKWCFGKSYFCFCCSSFFFVIMLFIVFFCILYCNMRQLNISHCSSFYLSEAHPNKKDKKEGFTIIGNQKEIFLSLRCFDISFQILLCITRLLSELPLWMLFFN